MTLLCRRAVVDDVAGGFAELGQTVNDAGKAPRQHEAHDAAGGELAEALLDRRRRPGEDKPVANQLGCSRQPRLGSRASVPECSLGSVPAVVVSLGEVGYRLVHGRTEAVPLRAAAMRAAHDPSRGVVAALASAGSWAIAMRTKAHTDCVRVRGVGPCDRRRYSPSIGPHVDAAFLDAYQGHAALAKRGATLVGWSTIMRGSFMVNLSGHRFGNETTGYSEYAAQQANQEKAEGWLVFDQRIHDQSLVFTDFRQTVEGGALAWADTLQELAEAISVDLAALVHEAEGLAQVAAGAAEDRFGRRSAYDPAVQRLVDQGAAGCALTSAGPVGVDERWDHLRHDTGYSAVLWISEWPRVEVPSFFLHALVFQPGIRKTLSITATPLSTQQAMRDIRKAKVESLTDSAQKARIGAFADLADERELGDVLERERALIGGHADLRFTGLLAVTAAERDELESAIAQVERAATQAGCETRRLVGQQARAFTAAALPLARKVD